MIGISGPSGSGKSLLADLICGLLKTDQGKILLGEKEIIKNLKEWQNNIGYITQNIYLIENSIEENITFGTPDEKIDKNKIKKLIDVCQLNEFVNNLEQKEKTFIGERSANISGGQKQRIGIARALYRDPKILIFDESFSGIDHNTSDKILKNLKHNFPKIKTIIISHSEKILDKADEVYLIIHGRGGHAALPQDVVDPILVASNILVQLQQVISRKSIPNVPNVLSFGKINSDGGATNVIPERVFIEGTFRTMDEKWRMEAHEHIRRIATKVAESMEATCEVDIRVGYPCLYNDIEATSRVKQLAIDYLGLENVIDLPIRMTAEDFAYYSQEMPACFYRLGTGNVEKGITSPVHTPTFDIDEEALKVGMGFMAYSVIGE